MYKVLLCWRYLLTRYLALICIISVMLGVATLIVVNSVMSGFSTKLRDRLHGLLSDVVIEGLSYEGFPDPDRLMQQIRDSKEIGDKIEVMTPAIETFAILQFRLPSNGEWVTKPIHLIGVDAKGRAELGGFAEYLFDHNNRPVDPSFELPRDVLESFRAWHPATPMPTLPLGDDGVPAPAPWTRPEPPPPVAFIGHAIGSYRDVNTAPGDAAQDHYMVYPGDQVTILTASVPSPGPGGTQKLQPVRLTCAVKGYVKTGMSEYDGNYVYVPIDYLQEARLMNIHGDKRVSSIQIKLKHYADARSVVEFIKANLCPPGTFLVQTWEEKQGPLLAAISVEKGILNVLLFLIIAVAGFGILAIFSMIVAEKTRDIGVLKALGASNSGVMKIFLGYGLLLGVVGAVFGTGLGLAITTYINEIERWLAKTTGQEVFPRSIYYFDRIPTDIQALSVALVNIGAVVIAVVFSILPALRAAMLHPVRALRYE